MWIIKALGRQAKIKPTILKFNNCLSTLIAEPELIFFWYSSPISKNICFGVLSMVVWNCSSCWSGKYLVIKSGNKVISPNDTNCWLVDIICSKSVLPDLCSPTINILEYFWVFTKSSLCLKKLLSNVFFKNGIVVFHNQNCSLNDLK